MLTFTIYLKKNEKLYLYLIKNQQLITIDNVPTNIILLYNFTIAYKFMQTAY